MEDEFTIIIMYWNQQTTSHCDIIKNWSLDRVQEQNSNQMSIEMLDYYKKAIYMLIKFK